MTNVVEQKQVVSHLFVNRMQYTGLDTTYRMGGKSPYPPEINSFIEENNNQMNNILWYKSSNDYWQKVEVKWIRMFTVETVAQSDSPPSPLRHPL